MIIMSAADFEIAAVVKSLADHGRDFSVVHCGVGVFPPLESSASLRQQCLGRDVLFIGTCGIFGKFISPQLVTVDTVCWEPSGDRLGASYPVPKLDPFSVSPLPGLPVFRMVCGPSVSVDARGIPPNVATVENIEFYSVLRALQASARSIRALFCVTNAIGPEAHVQWKANFARAGEMSAECVLKHWNSLGGSSAI